jgi:hypothetical protein
VLRFSKPQSEQRDTDQVCRNDGNINGMESHSGGQRNLVEV